MTLKRLDVKNPVLYNKVHFMTSDYKTRNNDRSVHEGIDMIGKNYSTDYITTIDDGIVITCKYSTTAGYYIEIKHRNNYISRYLHMKKNTFKVKKNQVVKKGDILGYMGSTGNSTGAHLHFAVMDSFRHPVDPLPYLTGERNFQGIDDAYVTFIKNLQKTLKLEVTGIADTNLFNKTITISKTINRKHPFVKFIQTYLYALGYHSIGSSDGVAGIKFEKAVKEFQKDNNCVIDGVITKKNKTWKKLLRLN